MARRVIFRDLLPAVAEPVDDDDDPIFSPLEKGQQPLVLHSIFSPEGEGGAPFSTFPPRLNSGTSNWIRRSNSTQQNGIAIYISESSSAPHKTSTTSASGEDPTPQVHQPQKKSPFVVVSPTHMEYSQVVPVALDNNSPQFDPDNNSDSLHCWPKESPRSDVPAVHGHGDHDLWTPRKSRTKGGGRQNAPNRYDPFRKSSQKQQSPASFGDLSEILISPASISLSSLALSSDTTTTTKIILDDISASNKSVTSTSTAFRTLEKLEWLELDSIRLCNSVPQLVRIIAVLQAERTAYPSLLRAARERLEVVRGPGLPDSNNNLMSLEVSTKISSPIQLDNHPSPMAPISPDSVMADVSHASRNTAENDNDVPKTDKSSRANTSTRTNDASQSSLVMSLSTDVDEEEYFLTRPATQPPNSAKERELREQVDKLTQTIIEMEQLSLMEAPSCRRCQNTQRQSALHQTQQNLQQSNVDTKELLQSVEDLRQQNQNLQEQIQQEATEREQKRKVSVEMENRLYAQVHEIQLQLTLVRGQSAKDQSSFQSKQLELNQSLRTAQRSLERLQADRDALIQTLLQATGRRDSAADLSLREQKRLVQDICHRAASNQRDLDRMAQQVTEAERHKVYALQVQRRSEARLTHTVKSLRQLEQENSMLMGQIQSLSEKLRASRQQLDKLYSSGQAMQLKEFQVREQSYKQIIQEMKEQLSKNVPVDVYRQALAEAQQRAVECQSYREDATTLSGRVAKLEKQLKQERSQTMTVVPPPPPLPNVKAHVVPVEQPKPPPPSEPAVAEQGKIAAEKQSQHLKSSLKSGRITEKAALSKKVQITSPKTPESVTPSISTPARGIENGSNAWPAPKQSPTLRMTMTSPRSADRSALRSTVVRAAGGRRALQQKLQSMRSPKAGVEHYNRKLEQMGIRPLPLREATIYHQQQQR